LDGLGRNSNSFGRLSPKKNIWWNNSILSWYFIPNDTLHT
jgi:hypothetical protein